MITLTALPLPPNFPLEYSCNFYKDFFTKSFLNRSNQHLPKGVFIFQSLFPGVCPLSPSPPVLCKSLFLPFYSPCLTLNQFSGFIFLPLKMFPFPTFESPLTLNPSIFHWLPQSLKSFDFLPGFIPSPIYYYLFLPPI